MQGEGEKVSLIEEIAQRKRQVKKRAQYICRIASVANGGEAWNRRLQRKVVVMVVV